MRSATKLDAKLQASIAPGKKVWLSAYWENPRGERGPCCRAISTHVGYEVSLSRMLKAA